MVSVCPAIVSVPFLGEPSVLAATVNVTVPFPVPLVPEVMVIKGELVTAVHAQLATEVTFTVPAPPAAEKSWLVLDNWNPQAFPGVNVKSVSETSKKILSTASTLMRATI
jgi:hypothetical protein